MNKDQERKKEIKREPIIIQYHKSYFKKKTRMLTNYNNYCIRCLAKNDKTTIVL